MLVPSMFGNDESDVIVLLVGAEAPHFVHDGSQRGLWSGPVVAPEGFDEAQFAELLLG